MMNGIRLYGCVLLLLCGLIAKGEQTMSDSRVHGFVENKGQVLDQFGRTNQRVIAVHRTPGLTTLLNNDGFSYQVESRSVNDETHYHRIDVVFDGISKSCRIEKLVPSADFSNFRIETDEGVLNLNDIRSFESVIYRNIYDGVDGEFVIDKITGAVKFNFILTSKDAINNIKLKYAGQLNDPILGAFEVSKKLELNTNFGTLEESVPASFFVDQEKRIEVLIGYRENQKGQIVFEFMEQPSDCPGCKLVIDPTPTITWSTYFGGTAADQGFATTMDGFGFVYIGGNTSSASSIATTGAHQGVFGGAPFNDAFIAKFDYAGARIWSTYFGGTNDDQLFDLTTDGLGNVFFAGASTSTAAIATAGSFQTTNAGNSDAFFGAINSAGVLQWCSYFGGPMNDFARSIEVTASNIYICGSTASSSGIATAGAHLTAFAGGTSDAFVAEFSLLGSRNWSTYVGGSLADTFYGVEVNSAGEIFLGGTTNSVGGIATAGAHQTSLAGNNDAMIVSFDGSGTLRWGTYMGGNLADNLLTVSMDVTDRLLIAGQTYSAAGIASVGAFDTAIAGSSDGFLAVFDAAGTRVWSTYLGGNSVDQCYFSFFDASGNAYVGGHTSSTSGLSTAGAAQTSYGGGAADAFIAQFTGAGTSQWVTYMGGAGDDYGRSAVVDVINGVFMTGTTNSSSSISTTGAHQASIGATSASDAFLILYGASFMLPITLLDFHAVQQGNDVLCNWQAEGEDDCFRFHLERSTDALHWSMLTEMECNVTADGENYQFLDVHPEKGLAYYRLSEVDQTGSPKQSRIASVNFDGGSELFLFPVPANEFISANIVVQADELSSCSIYNSVGQLVFEQQVRLMAGVNKLDFALNEIPNGLYHLKIHHEDGSVTTLPFVKAAF